MSQKTLLIVKPDGMREEVFTALEEKFKENDLTVLNMVQKQISKEVCETLYAEHKGKFFFEDYTGYISSDEIRIFALEGENSVSKVRAFIGATNPDEAEKGTIRGDYILHPVHDEERGIIRNTVHASSDPDAALYELEIFFPELFAEPVMS